MRSSRLSRNTRLFLLFLLLGGVGHMVERYAALLPSTVLFCAGFANYSGLLIFWILSVRSRLLPSRAKSYCIASAGLMALFLFLRTFKYRACFSSAPMSRLCWYGYYLPIVLVPTLFLMSCIRFGSAPRRKWDERLLMIPAGLITLGVLTNDLHSAAFVPRVPARDFFGRNGTYAHGPLYYIAWGWAGLSLTAGIITLLRIFRGRSRWHRTLPPLSFMLLIPVLILLHNGMVAHGLPAPYNLPEIVIFCFLGMLESCIRLRLIPHNEGYPDFFARMPLPSVITDLAFSPVYRTARPVPADAGQLAAALRGPLQLDADTRLQGMRVHGGYAFFTEDAHSLNRLNEQLQDANATLALENELIQRERELADEKAGIEARDALYTRAAQAVYPAQKRIAALLDAAEPDTPAFRPAMARALALTAYVKRKANFVMLSAERQTITAEELASALRESAHYFTYCGLDVTVTVLAAQSLPIQAASAVYDCFEASVETLLERTAALWIRLDDSALRILADGDVPPELPPLPLPVSCACQDGQVTLRFAIGGEGA